ncbi:MAG: protein phosphatase 2C domain-containing protein [Saprospiraceae bacterium]
MSAQFKNIVSHTHQGRRDYQEDSYSNGATFLIVSDGVGGLTKGNIASGIVKDVWQEALEQRKILTEDIEGNVQSIVLETIYALNNYAKENPESMGMGATLACTAIIDDKIIALHVGDSRVYHFSRDGEIKWRSTDHSLVQELVTSGIITEEEAATHPRRNVITRVLQAKEGHETKAAIHVLDKIVSGDIIMVCSDGVTESWSDAGLSSVIISHQELSDIMRVIGAHSAQNSSDNNTAVIAEIILEGNGVFHDAISGACNLEDMHTEGKFKQKSTKPTLTHYTIQKKAIETHSVIPPPVKQHKINPIWISLASLGIVAFILYIMLAR